MSESIDQAQRDIVEEFSFFDDWGSRYQYLIDLGRALPEFPDAFRVDEHKVQGCQSQVWLVSSGDAKALHFQATSDALIVSGLIALILKLYSGRPAAEILSTEPWFVKEVGLDKHLSPSRSNGLFAMLNRVREHAAHTLNAN